MISALQRRFALSRQGAKDLVKGCVACLIQDLSFMAPVCVLYYFVLQMMEGGVTDAEAPLYWIGVVACLAFIFGAAWFQYDSTYLATYVESGVRRVSLAEKLRRLPLAFFARRDLADLTNSIMNDCAVLETAFSHYFPALVGAIASAALIGSCLFAFDWRMALAAVWVLPIAFAIVGFSSRAQQAMSRKQTEAEVAIQEGAQEFVECLPDLRMNNAQRAYLKGLDRKIDHAERRHVISEAGVAVFVVSAGLILKLGVATVALVGSSLLASGELTAATFFMFLLVASRLYAPLEGALQNMAAVISTRANIDRMNEILDYPVQEGDDRLTNVGADIVFQNVGFAYEDGEEVLTDVSFTARQGDVTAIVGPSGGGKTTVSRLAARFWDPDRGTILTGGMDISKIDPETLLSLYSIVFQDVTLFNDTVMENIRIGRKNATDEEVREAARRANCDEFVSKLPRGYDTMIGENGCELSGGERQRLSIARALLKDAPILLLDEATASLDAESETLVQSALSRLIRDRTTLVIAHRMRAVRGADKVVVLSGGKVAEQGSPEELEKHGTIFPQMERMQNLARKRGIRDDQEEMGA